MYTIPTCSVNIIQYLDNACAHLSRNGILLRMIVDKGNWDKLGNS